MNLTNFAPCCIMKKTKKEGSAMAEEVPGSANAKIIEDAKKRKEEAAKKYQALDNGGNFFQ